MRPVCTQCTLQSAGYDPLANVAALGDGFGHQSHQLHAPVGNDIISFDAQVDWIKIEVNKSMIVEQLGSRMCYRLESAYRAAGLVEAVLIELYFCGSYRPICRVDRPS